MTLTTFLFAAQGLMVEEGLSFTAQTAAEAREPSPAEVREQNARSMAMLRGMMGGVQGAPKVPR